MDYLLSLELRGVSLSYELIVYPAVYRSMPRPRRDGTPARSEPNKRRLSDAFIRTVRPDPDRVIVYWDTLQRGLALTVQPSGHLAWKCVYTVRGRGSALVSHRQRQGRIADRCPPAGGQDHGIRSPRAETRMRIGLRCAAGVVRAGGPTLRQGARQQAEQELAASGRAGRQVPAATLGQAGYRQHQAGRRQGRHRGHRSARSWRTRCWLRPARSSAGRCGRRSSLRTRALGVERNDTTSRERVLSDAEIAAFWPHLSAPLKMILLTGQRPGEVAHLHRAHVVDDRWWAMPGAPDPKTSWPGTKNAQSHRVWLSEPVHELLPDVLAASMRTGQMQQDMRSHLRQARGQREGDATRSAPDVLLQGHRARVRPRGR